jgi:hypothetical protein
MVQLAMYCRKACFPCAFYGHGVQSSEESSQVYDEIIMSDIPLVWNLKRVNGLY